MDTNLVAIIAKLVSAKPDGGQNTALVVGMVLAAIAPTLAAVAAWLQSKAALRNTEDAKATAIKTSEEVGKIHQAVNSERSAMLEQVKALKDEILEISKEKAVLEARDTSHSSVTKAELEQVLAKLTTKPT